MAKKAKVKGQKRADSSARPKSQIRSKKGVGKAQKREGLTLSNPSTPVKLYLLITRASGDVERHPLGEVQNLLAAYDYKRKVQKVALPKRVKKASDGYEGRLVYAAR